MRRPLVRSGPGPRPAGALSILLALSASTLAAAQSFRIQASADQRSPFSVGATWRSLTLWSYAEWVTSPLPGATAQYPFLTYAELFTATGGCYAGYPGCSLDLDLFVDPADPSQGYNFTSLLLALQNIVGAGFTPHIVTGNVPIAFSTSPALGAFGVNTSPPANFTQYADYIAALASAIRASFGIEAVRSWRWGVLTEYNNPDWYKNTAEAYFDLYDWTVCALERALGAENLTVGAHACTQCTNGWDPLELVAHVQTGTSACTGQRGVQLDYLSESFYEVAPNNPGDLSGFASNVGLVRQTLDAAGLSAIEVGIDEGRLLNGPDGLPSVSRSMGHSYQGSFDAFFFKAMVYANVSYYSRWSVNSNGLRDWNVNADAVATNLARLTYRMQGERVVLVTNSSSSSSMPGATPAEEMVDAAVSVDVTSGQLHVLVFHHQTSMGATGSADVDVAVCGLRPSANLEGTQWRLDDTHGNFWPQWWADKTAQNITSFLPGWSIYSETVNLLNRTEQIYFWSRAPVYQALATLQPAPFSVATNASGCLEFTWTLPHHGVTLFELPAAVPV